MKQSRDIDAVAKTLDVALHYGMTAEVWWSAMRIYEKHHSSAPETYNMKWALECALNDWDLPLDTESENE
ncbi:hypothetical protein CMI37_13495 [Candidatus Pacearchaeota archaeon]|nr:hypothetical protein [Candidatus Pacearchaeota archaeon]|tara:strand:+ start:2057 stop:2266 length:210 start_codon:yes stop_codon:yes gene_type:complete